MLMEQRCERCCAKDWGAACATFAPMCTDGRKRDPLADFSRNESCRLICVRVSLQYHLMRTELVTTLKRRATEILSELENEKTPMLITQYGKRVWACT